MNTQKEKLFSTSLSYALTFLLAFIVYGLQQGSFVKDIFLYLHLLGNDDVMRLASVRDLIAGQAWYDTTQYRVLPPEGVSMHWSRYIDGTLAGLIIVFSWLFSSDVAEKIVVSIWPLMLFILYLWLIGSTARSVFGTPAACYTLIAAGFLPYFSTNIFNFGRIDHHNIQVIAIVGICATLVLRGSPRVLGMLGGGIAAISLAVGLETILFIGCAGLILTGRYILDQPGSSAHLAAFGASAGIFSPLLFAGQTAPSLWGVAQCDMLSLPLIFATTGAAVFCITLGLVATRFRSKQSRTILTLGLVIIIGSVLFPHLRDCISGPYSTLPPEVQAIVIGGIIEAVPISQLISVAPFIGLSLILPLFLVTIFAGGYFLFGNSDNGIEYRGIGTLSMFLLLGLLSAQIQVRAAIVGYSILPIGFGFVVWKISATKLGNSRALKGTLIFGFGALVLSLHLIAFTIVSIIRLIDITPQIPKNNISTATTTIEDKQCLHAKSLVELNKLNPAMLLVPFNYGARILVSTHHSTATAAYHRNGDAMANGVIPYLGSGREMLKVLQKYKVDYVIVCQNQLFGSKESIGTKLSQSKAPAWLKLQRPSPAELFVWRVLRDKNGKVINTPLSEEQ